jgi:hypothetical protein
MNRIPLIVTSGLLAPMLAILPACDSRSREEAPAARTPAPAAPSQPAPAAADGPATTGDAVNLLGLTFALPAGWERVPPANSMRLAELRIPAAPAAAFTTITFTSAGGDVRANLERWAAQFSGGSEASFGTREINGLTVHFAEASGTYRNMGEPPQEGFALRGAVVPSPRGTLFIKMTGPADQIQRESAAFDAMLQSMQPG